MVISQQKRIVTIPHMECLKEVHRALLAVELEQKLSKSHCRSILFLFMYHSQPVNIQQLPGQFILYKMPAKQPNKS